MITHIGLTAIPSKTALMINTMGAVGNQITKNKLAKASKNPKVSTNFAPKRLSKKPITKFVAASEMKCIEIAIDVIPTAIEVAVGSNDK